MQNVLSYTVNDYSEYKMNLAADLKTNFTIAFWAKIGGNGMIISEQVSVSDYIYISNSTSVFTFYSSEVGLILSFVLTTYLNAWHFYTIVVTGGTVNLYIDGVLVSTVVKTLTRGIKKAGLIRIGKGTTYNGAIMSMCNYHLYTRALTLAEIKTIISFPAYYLIGLEQYFELDILTDLWHAEERNIDYSLVSVTPIIVPESTLSFTYYHTHELDIVIRNADIEESYKSIFALSGYCDVKAYFTENIQENAVLQLLIKKPNGTIITVEREIESVQNLAHFSIHTVVFSTAGIYELQIRYGNDLYASKYSLIHTVEVLNALA
jgi:hypothetical protein